jgi:serine/threonine protein kinase
MRIPDSKRLEQVILTDDLSFIDFIKQCLVLDPDERFCASEALNHPWIYESKSPQIMHSKIIHKRTSSDFS